MTIEPQLLNIREVARLLGVTPKTVQRLAADGRLAPAKRIGPKILRWFPADVDTFLHRLGRGDFDDGGGTARQRRRRPAP